MAVIDSNNFITHLVWSGLIDKATCGELKEAIELCTVKDIYTKADMVAMLEDLDIKIDEMYEPQFSKEGMDGFYWAQGLFKDLVQQKINALEGDKNDV